MEEYEIECTVCRERMTIYSKDKVGKAYVFGCEKCKGQTPENVSTYKELETGDNRPMTWAYQLDSLKGSDQVTNTISILSRPVLNIDESGEHGYELFATLSMTRAEIAELLDVLEEDIKEMRAACPKESFCITIC